jgi:hypothetical protein
MLAPDQCVCCFANASFFCWRPFPNRLPGPGFEAAWP